MTAQQINSISTTEIITISKKVGSLGSMPIVKILKMTDVDYREMTETEVFMVVTRQGILNYCDTLVAAYEGKEGIDFIKFKTAVEVSEFLGQYKNDYFNKNN